MYTHGEPKGDIKGYVECIFMLMGKVVEHAPTEEMFVTPTHRETADYIEGRYG